MKIKALTLFTLTVMILGTFTILPSLPFSTPQETVSITDEPMNEMESFAPEIQEALSNMLAGDTIPGIEASDDIGMILQDSPNNYRTSYEPWKSKAAIHALAYHDETGFLALGGGYLYDNEIHIYRLNSETGDFDKVWDSGDSIILADILSLAWGDTDLNDFLEVAAASADGKVHVFEQRHIYDPQANTENMFDHVWSSPTTFRAFDVAIADVDRDFRPDLIVGSWDGKVRCYEYDEHSGYPFVEDHWISYREVWNSGDTIDGRIYTIAIGDTNYNGLPEIIAGTREGKVYVFENAGVNMMINGEPFPLVRDNAYDLVWSSENYTWTPIMDMEAGELDGTPGEEIALVAQGQGVFILNWNTMTQSYYYQRVFRPWDAWQSESPSPWRLDYWADSIVSANNVTYDFNNGTLYPEPIDYEYLGGGYFYPDAQCYPFNTGLANETDGYFSVFDAAVSGVDNATAVVDFGKDEEGTGSASVAWDIMMEIGETVTSAFRDNVNISISQQGGTFEQVDPDCISWSGSTVFVDVDYALGRQQWDWFRYMKISVFNDDAYSIDSIKLAYVYTQLTTALTVTLGPLPTEFNYYGPPDQSNKLIVGNVMGNFLAFDFNGVNYDLIWDSARDDFFSIGENVWDMVYVGFETNVPIFLKGAQNYIAQPFGGVYKHWSIGDLNPYDWAGNQNPHQVLVIGSGGDVNVYNTVSGYVGETPISVLDYDPVADLYFADITTWIDDRDASMEIAVISDDFVEYPYPLAFVGVYENLISEYEMYSEYPGAAMGDIRVFERYDPDLPFDNLDSRGITSYDYNGDIANALTVAKTTPRMSFVDWDGDGDNDMILSTGFVYYCENLGPILGGTTPKFFLHQGYFSELNAGSMNDYWGQPDAADIDGDGQMELILSYDTRMGATMWDNEGSVDEPVWVEKKKVFSNTNPDTNFKFQEYTDLRVAQFGWGMPQDFWREVNSEATMLGDSNYTLMTYQPSTYYVNGFWPEYGQSSSYVVATYPEVSRYEFAIQDTGAENFGYHIYESWSTESDLEQWTLSITSGDVDGDGKGELIIGDYDNNIYIFEHMLNDTYKRAFRSFDINHTIESTTSPYYWEELEGISGTFNRVIWDHVKRIIADCDLDGDGLKELVAAADMQIYVFEDTGIDDTYDLAYTIDFRDSIFNATSAWDDVYEVTAIGAGDDFDANGENELVVAIGPYLFVYNIPYNSWNDADEYFMGNTIDGKYYLVGNGADEADFSEAWIQTMTLCDTDEDGYMEMIIGGKINTTQIRQDGFLKIYEWTGISFEEVWDAPSELTFWNPITSVVLDDQDYDSKQEIIIGHTKGFDIWEWDGTDSSYEKVEVVTSSPNYPYIDLNSTRTTEIEWDSVWSNRGANDMSYFIDASDWLINIYCNSSRLHAKFYVPGMGWIWSGQLLPDVYAHFPSYTVYNEMEPSLLYAHNGTLYVTWRTQMWTGSAYRYDLWITRYLLGVGFDEPYYITGASDRHNPKAFLLDSGILGITYININSDYIFWRGSTSWGGSWSTSQYLMFGNYMSYSVQSFDLAELPNHGYALAISAKNSTLAKTDLDIFVSIANSTMHFGPTYQATSSYHNEIYPDLGVLAAPEESLMVVYETPDAAPEDRVQMSYSNTYRIWHQSEPLASLPNYIIRQELPGGIVKYACQGSIPDMAQVYSSSVYSPSVVGRRDGGFMYTLVFDFLTKSGYQTPYHDADILDSSNPYLAAKYVENADLVYGINPSSRFTHFNIESVVELDVGDTDGDARREVIAAFGNHVGVYELAHSNVGGEIQEHEEAWYSNEFENPVTGLTVYDMNGNGFEEIGVSCERGDVFVFEYDNAASDRVNLLYSEALWTSDPGTTCGTYSGKQIAVYDIDGDGKDEIFRGELDGTVRAFDDDGTELWSNDDCTDEVYWLEMGEMAPGEVYISVARIEGNNSLINAVTGATIFNNYEPNLYIFGLWIWMPGIIDYGDVLGDNDSEIIGSSSFGNISVWKLDGTLAWQHSFGSSMYGQSICVGNFTGSSKMDIGVFHDNGSLSILYGNNGTLYMHVEGEFGARWVDPYVFDINDDGYDDILTGRKRLWAIDGHTGDVLYNSTNEFPGWIDYIYVDDYDVDSKLEVIIVSNDDIAFEEITSGRLVWTYHSEMGIVTGAMLGNFSGRTGLGVALLDGAVVALDALTGVPMWFDISSDSYDGIAVGDFDGDGSDELAACVDTGVFEAFDSVIPEEDVHEPILEQLTQYWQKTPDQSSRDAPPVVGVWTADLTSDGIDEVVVADGNDKVYVYDSLYPVELWNASVAGEVVDVQFADFDSDGTLDLLVLSDDEGTFKVVGLYGTSGAPVSGISIELSPTYTACHIRTGNFIDAISGTEFIIVMTSTSVNTGAGVYNRGGELIYTTSVNVSLQVGDVVVGNWNGDADLDFAVGYATGIIRFYTGKCGDLGWYSASDDIVDMDVGDFNGDAYDDIVAASSDGYVRSIDGFARSWIWFQFQNGLVDSVFAGQLYTGSATDDIAINVREKGVLIYEGSVYTLLWNYSLPSSAPKEMYFENVDASGDAELILVQEDHVAVITLYTDVIMTTYGTSNMYDVAVGNFDDKGILDLVYYNGNSVFVVTNGTIPPSPPVPAVELQMGSLIESIITASAIGIPLTILLIAPIWPLLVKKKDEE